MFKKRDNIKEVEEGKYLEPKFDENGLIPVITTDFKTGDILMHGYMNDEALKKTIETKEAYYWSRSRKKIWHKGQISGFVQTIKEIRIDDDQDSVWLSVDIGNGAIDRNNFTRTSEHHSAFTLVIQRFVKIRYV